MSEIEVPGDFAAFETAVLGDLDSDAVGVHELWWEANTRWPHLPVSERLALAELLVAQLLTRGLAELFVGRWTGPDDERTRVDDPRAALLDWASWVPQHEAVLWLHPVAG